MGAARNQRLKDGLQSSVLSWEHQKSPYTFERRGRATSLPQLLVLGLDCGDQQHELTNSSSAIRSGGAVPLIVYPYIVLSPKDTDVEGSCALRTMCPPRSQSTLIHDRNTNGASSSRDERWQQQQQQQQQQRQWHLERQPLCEYNSMANLHAGSILSSPVAVVAKISDSP